MTNSATVVPLVCLQELSVCQYSVLAHQVRRHGPQQSVFHNTRIYAQNLPVKGGTTKYK
jgi:hypothetical protein